MQKDQYQHPDYYLLDELLTDEHKLIRDAVRAYVKKEISPIIEEHEQNNNIKGLPYSFNNTSNNTFQDNLYEFIKLILYLLNKTNFKRLG